MRSTLRRWLRAGAVVVAASTLLVGVGLASADTDARTAHPGAAGVGDRLFPNLGNGGYTAQHYDLSMTYPTREPVQQVHGVVRMTAAATESLSSFDLDYGGQSIEWVRVNGQPARFDYQRDREELVITPAQPLWRGRTFTAEVAFTGGPRAPAAGDEIPFGWVAYTAKDPAQRGGSFTSFQPAEAHRAFPVNDHPSSKATYSIHLDVPQGITAVANGDPVCQHSANGRTVFNFEEREKIAAELLIISAGDDLSIIPRGTIDGVTWRDVESSGARSLVEPAFVDGASHLRWLTNQLGPYPFSQYGNFAPDLRFGYSLETQGLTLHSPGLFDPTYHPEFGTGQPWLFKRVMVHEDSHQWFGDSVSPAMWSDVWLNEGPATFYEWSYAQAAGLIADAGYPDFTTYMKSTYALGNQWRNTYGPVAFPKPREDNLYFNPNLYDGGALVLYALQQKVGDDTFRAIMRGWAQQKKGTSQSTDAWIAFAGRVAHQDLTGFLRDWLYGNTTPVMPGHPDWKVDPVTPASPSTAAAAGAPAAGGSVPSPARGSSAVHGIADRLPRKDIPNLSEPPVLGLPYERPERPPVPTPIVLTPAGQ